MSRPPPEQGVPVGAAQLVGTIHRAQKMVMAVVSTSHAASGSRVVPCCRSGRRAVRRARFLSAHHWFSESRRQVELKDPAFAWSLQRSNEIELAHGKPRQVDTKRYASA